MLQLLALVCTSLVTLTWCQPASQVPPLRLKIARNDAAPNDSVIISWELPPAPVESFSLEWEGVTNGQGAEIPVPIIPGKIDRYSVILSPLVKGEEYSVEVTALLAPPLRLSEFKTFVFAPMALVDVEVFGITSRSMGLNITALEPLTDADVLRVSVRSNGAVVTNTNTVTVGNIGKSRLVKLNFPSDIATVPPTIYQITVQSLWLGSAGSSVSEWVTLESVPSAPISSVITGLTPYAMELDVVMANAIDYSQNFSLIADVFDMDGNLYTLTNGVIQSFGGNNQTLRLFFQPPLPMNQTYLARLKTDYNGQESYWFADLETVFLHPATTSIGSVVAASTTAFNVTLLFGTEIAAAYILYWTSKDNLYAGNATFQNAQSLQALQLTVSGLVPGQTYDVAIDALDGVNLIKGINQLVTLAPSSPIFIGIDRNQLSANDSVVLKWRSGQGKSEKFNVALSGPGLNNYQVEQIAAPGRENVVTEYTIIVPNLQTGNNYLGNLTSVVENQVQSEPTQFGFTFAQNAPISAELIGLTPLQAELKVTQYEDVSPSPLQFTVQDNFGTVYPLQNGTLVSSDGRDRYLRLFFNPPLAANRAYFIAVQSQYNGEMSIPVFTREPFTLDPLIPTLIDVQSLDDEKALVLWLPGETIPIQYIVDWLSLNSSDAGSLRVFSPPQYFGGPLNTTIVNLTSSHTYIFNVRDLSRPPMKGSLNFTLNMPPAAPRDVRIFPTPSTLQDSFTVAWVAGRGRIDYFNVTIAGSDGLFEQLSVPIIPGELQYNVTVSPITPLATYIANVYTVSGDALSEPVNFRFVNVPSAPSSVSVTGIAQYSIDLSYTLLDGNADLDSIEVVVEDTQGVQYPPENITTTIGAGDQRTIRLIYNESNPLPLDREYIVTLRTISNNTVSAPVVNGNPISIDPLTPSVVGVFSDGPSTIDRSATYLALVPGSQQSTGFLVEWISTDGSEMGNLTYIPPPDAAQRGVLTVPLENLTPGQSYIIRVTAQGPSGISRPLETYVALNPLSPFDVVVQKDAVLPSPHLLLSWSSPGGRIDYYNIDIEGSDGSFQTFRYRPTLNEPITGPFSIPLTTLRKGNTYSVAVRSVVDEGLASDPAIITFTQVASAPTDLSVKQVGQKSAEFEVTLLDDGAADPDVEILLIDDQGQIYNGTSYLWEGSGRTRLLRVDFADNVLPANSNYTASIRTLNNGTWTTPIITDTPTFLDPLTPSVLGAQAFRDGANVTAFMTLIKNPGAESYRLEWFSKNGTEYGTVTYDVDPLDINDTVTIPARGLSPGQSYVFGVQAYGSNRSIAGLNYPLSIRPSTPISLKIDRDPFNGPFILQWNSGGGRAEYYVIRTVGSDAVAYDSRYLPTNPSDVGPFRSPLPRVNYGQTYIFYVWSVSNGLQSDQASMAFRFIDSDVTGVEVLGMTPYSAELGVVLLGNATEIPETEVFLVDPNTRTDLLLSNDTVWQGNGRERVLRVNFADQPLRADRDYSMSVRTKYNDTWGFRIDTENFITLDPLTPSVAGMRLTPEVDTVRTGTSTSAVIGVQPGEALVERYQVDWWTVDEMSSWNTSYTPTANEAFRAVEIPITGLVPGQQYVFRVTAFQGERNVSGLNYNYTQDPAVPQSVQISKELTSPDQSLFLSWNSGGGKADRYDINIASTAGGAVQQQYFPTGADNSFVTQLPPLIQGGTYTISIASVAGTKQSLPSIQQFRYVDSDPTSIRLTSMTPYSAEFEVTLLGNTTENPELEVLLQDGQGQDLFIRSNDTVWRGTGSERTVQVRLSDRPLRAGSDYSVAVRAKYNDTWSSPLSSANFITLDPLTPSISSIVLTPEANSTRTGTSTSAVIGVQPGEALVERYQVDWWTVDEMSSWNTSYTPTANEAFRAVEIPITGLVPGQQYVFMVTAFQGERNVSGFNYSYTQDPSLPALLRVEVDPTSALIDGLRLTWSSGGGITDFYDINIIGSDGVNENTQYEPAAGETSPYTIPLPPLTQGVSYALSIETVAGPKRSRPVIQEFRYVDSDPTEVRLLGMTPYSAELGVSLLRNTTANPDIEVNLRDGQGRNLFLTSNDTVWSGTGQNRVVRVKLSDQPLRANRDYRVAVTTNYNGRWNNPLLSNNFVSLDPLTPSISSISLVPNANSSQTGTSTSAVIGVQPGEALVERYQVDWWTVDEMSSWNTSYTPTANEAYQPVTLPVANLVPGQQYVFRVMAYQGNRSAAGLNDTFTVIPSIPQYLKVDPLPNSNNGSLVLSWTSGGGITDFYRVSIEGSDGQVINQDYFPLSSRPSPEGYKMMLPQVTDGESYAITISSVLNSGISSYPASMIFTALSTAPTEVKLKQMTQYGGELEVTLLGNSSVTPDLEVTLKDSQGVEIITSNDTTWEGSGRQRLVRVKFSENPLPANESYSVSVRTAYNGTWTSPVESQEPIILDPYTPAVMESETAGSTEEGSYTLVWRPGQTLAEQYLIEWKTQDGSESGNRTYIPTSVNPDGTLSVTFDTLTPGQRYEFMVTAMNQGQMSPGIGMVVEQRPSTPQELQVAPIPDSKNDTLLLSWKSGGGRLDLYRTRIVGSDGMSMQLDYLPLADHNESKPYSIMLPSLTEGQNYNISLMSVVDQNVMSYPAEFSFTSLPTAPTEVKLKQMTQYGGELEVTLLGNSSVTPDLEVTLRDSQGVEIITSNDTTWEGSGRQRLVRVKFSENPLPANESYSVSVRTAYNGTWSSPVESQEPVVLDPYTPAIMESKTTRSTEEGGYTLVWRPGQTLAEQYLIEWKTQDGSESGNRTYIPTSVNPDGTLSVTFDTLTPGQRYEFMVTAMNQGQMSPGVASVVERRPSMPQDVQVAPIPDSKNDTLLLSWKSGGGRLDLYRTMIVGSDGMSMQLDYLPLADHNESKPYSIMLPSLTEGQNYNISLMSVVDQNVMSYPAEFSFTSLPTAPTEVKLKQMTQYGGELEVTLLGNSSVTPDLEVTLRDSQGVEIITSNDTTWEGSGRQRLVRVKFSENPLPANESYSVSVRTAYNGTWTSPVESQEPVVLDPYTPAIMENRTLGDRGENSYTLVWRPGQTLAEQYLIEWKTQDGSESGNRTYIPTSVNPDGTLSVTFDTLTPGQRYEFMVTAMNQGQMSPGVASVVERRPSMPVSVTVEPNLGNDTLILLWKSGGGRSDFYRTAIRGSDGMSMQLDYLPLADHNESKPYSIMLPSLTEGQNYNISLMSVVDQNVMSYPAEFSFTSLPTAPTEVTLKQVTQYGGELEVTLLGNSTVTPDLEVTLKDSQGVEIITSNDTTWEGSGRQRLVRVKFSENPLPANESYSVSVRTAYNGTWTSPVESQEPVVLDPYTPAIMETVNQGSSPEGSYTLVWRPGQTLAEQYLIEWKTQDGSESGNRTYIPTSVNPDGTLSVTFDTLTPGQRYEFMVTAMNQGQMSPGIGDFVTLVPYPAVKLAVEPSEATEEILLTWYPGGNGRVSHYNVQLVSAQGELLNTNVIPDQLDVTVNTLISLPLSNLTQGEEYTAAVVALAGETVPSEPSLLTFRYSKAAPSRTTTGKVYQDAFEMNVTFLGKPVDAPLTEIQLQDEQGNLYPPINGSVIQKSPSYQIVRFPFDEASLPVNRSYTGTVRTLYEGVWSLPITTEVPLYVDPLAPAIYRLVFVPDGLQQTAVVSWESGAILPDVMVLGWDSVDGAESGQLNLPTIEKFGNSTITNLTPGQTYTFHLTASKDGASSSGTNITQSAPPFIPLNARIQPSLSSPSDTVQLIWGRPIGIVDFHRISMENSDGVVYNGDIPMPQVAPETLNTSLSPVVSGNWYHVMMWSAVNQDVLSSPYEFYFTFAPTAPTSINLQRMAVNSAEVEVEFFENVRSDIAQNLNITLVDESGLRYQPDRVLEWHRDGRRSHFRLWFDNGLPANQSFTATVSSWVNATWSQPMTTKSATFIDAYQPTILSVRRAGDRSAEVIWRPGATASNTYIVESRSKRTNVQETQTAENPVSGQDGSTIFGNLNPGHEYLFTVTGILNLQASVSFPFPFTLDPVAPSNLRVRYSEMSSNDTVMLMWDLVDGEVDFFRLTWSPLEGAVMNYTVDILPNATVVNGLATYAYGLNPLDQGETYRVLLQTVSSARPGKFVETIFTFAPSAPSKVQLTGATPDGIRLNVSLFDAVWDQAFVSMQVRDDNNNSYPINRNLAWQTDGRHAMSQIEFNNTRLMGGKNYTVTVQTWYDGNWSYPIMSTFYLDPMTPSIRQVTKDVDSPDGVLTVDWMTGSNVTDMFKLRLISQDGTEIYEYDFPGNSSSEPGMMSYTVGNLTAGQYYRVQAIAVQAEKQVPALDVPVQMDPSAPKDVVVDRYDVSANDSAVLKWTKGDGLVDSYDVIWGEYSPADQAVIPGTVTENVVPSDGLDLNQVLSPLEEGKTYISITQPVAGTLRGKGVQNLFTFAPTAPTNVEVRGVTPEAIGLNVTLFDDVPENFTVYAEVIDSNGVSYPNEVVVVNSDGRSTLVRVLVDNNRLPADENLRVELQTLYNEAWSYPIAAPITLNPLTPSIRSVKVDPESPDTAFSVEWIPGTVSDNQFLLELFTADGSEYINQTVFTDIQDINTPWNYTFNNLTAGQRYIVQLTSITPNMTETALNYTIQLLPSPATDVFLDTMDDSYMFAVFLHWKYADSIHDGFRVTVIEYSPGGQIIEVSDIPPNVTVPTGEQASYSHLITPLMQGQTYQVTLQPISGSKMGLPQSIIFTFDPTAPSLIEPVGVSPYGMDFNLTTFGYMGGDFPVYIEVTDSNNNTYPSGDVELLSPEGKTAIMRLTYNDTRLAPSQNYTVSIQTAGNAGWSYPYIVEVYLDSLTPAILNAYPDETSPDSVIHVVWVPGTLNTDNFTVSLMLDELPVQEAPLSPTLVDLNNPLNYSFTELSPGQQYKVKVTAANINGTASSRVWNVITHPEPPTNVTIMPWVVSPEESATLSWQYPGDMDVSFLVDWGVYGSDLPNVTEIPVLATSSRDMRNLTFQLTPLLVGETYWARIWSKVGDTTGSPVEKIFTFAPSAPTEMQADVITPNSVSMKVSLFGDNWENVTVQAEINDTNGQQYPTDDVVITEQDGRNAVVQFSPVADRLPADQDYVISVRTMVGDTWTSPVTTTATLDPLMPAIVSVGRHPESPDTAFTVSWLPGRNGTQEFLLEASAVDGSENLNDSLVMDVQDYNTQLNYTFVDLSPGQEYDVKLTARNTSSSATAQTSTVQLYPSSPLNVEIGRSELLPSEEVIFMWEYGDTLHDSFRITWSGVNFTSNFSEEILPNFTGPRKESSYSYQLYPLRQGETYQVRLETLVNGQSGEPVDTIFTFVPSAPTSLQLRGATPKSIGMNVTLFEDVWENVTLSAEVTDNEGNQYRPDNVTVLRTEGRSGMARILFEQDRLPAGRLYTVSLQTSDNGVFSYPIESTISLDTLTPAIVDVEPHPDAPSTAFIVTWVAGSNDTNYFILRLSSVDQTESRKENVEAINLDIDSVLNYTFTDLTPGQKYVIQVTAVMGNKTASTLNATVQLYPPTPTDVTVMTSVDKSDKIMFTWKTVGVVDKFVLEGVSTRDNLVRFEETVTGLEAVNNTFNYTVSDLVRGETYNVRVRTVDGQYTSESNITTISLYPGTPYDVQLRRFDPSLLDSLWLSWKSRGGNVDNYLIQVALSRGRGDQRIYNESSDVTDFVITPLQNGERYEVSISAVAGNLSSEVVTVASTVGPSVNIRGLTLASMDVELDLFGGVYPNMSLVINITDSTNVSYTPTEMQNLTEFAEPDRELIRLSFLEPLTTNEDYTANAVLYSDGQPVLQLESEPARLDGRTPHGLMLRRNEASPNTSLSALWITGTEMVDRYIVKWSQVNSPDVFTQVVETTGRFMMTNITDLLPGEMYKVIVEAETTEQTKLYSLPEYEQLVPALPVDLIAMKSEVEPRFTVQWTNGIGSIDCFNTTIWPEPLIPISNNGCLPATDSGRRQEVIYTNLLPGETYWSGISSVKGNLESDKVWVPVTMYPPGIQIMDMKEDPERGLVVEWGLLESGKIDSILLTWTTFEGLSNGSLSLLPGDLSGEIRDLSPGTSYIIGINSEVIDSMENVVSTAGRSLEFVTEPAPPEDALFETTKDGVMVNLKQGAGLADSYLLQWQSDQQRSGERRLSAEQAQNLNNSIDLSPGSRYIFTLQSVAGGKESAPRTETVVTAPGSPRNLFASLGPDNVNDVTLQWAAPLTYVQGYYLQWSPPTADNVSMLSINSSRTTTVTVPNLQPGTTYNFSLYSVAWDILSEAISTEIHVAPSMPRVLYAEPTVNTSIEVAWMFGPGNADAAYVFVNDGFNDKEIMVPSPAEPMHIDSQRVHSYRIENLKEDLPYRVSMMSGSLGVRSLRSPEALVVIPLEKEAPQVTVETSSRAAALTWDLSQESLPPSPLPIPDRYRIRVISPTVTNDTACLKEIVVGFCRDCETTVYSEPTVNTNAAFPCGETRKDYIPVGDRVTYNLTDLLPYSSYKLLWYPERGFSEQGTVFTATTDIEAPEFVPPPKVRMISNVDMEVCLPPPVPYPGPTEYQLHVYDNQLDGTSLLNINVTDNDLVGDSLIHCVNITGQPFWSYKFIVTATTEKGSLQSNYTIFQTPESAPGPVRNFEVQTIPYNYSAVRLVWDYPPEEQMGGNITRFVIRYWMQEPEMNMTNKNESTENGTMVETIVRELSSLSFIDGHIVTDLPIRPENNYSVQVLPMTSTGLVGNSSIPVSFASVIGPPPLMPESYPPVITQVTDTDGTNQLTVSINPEFFMDNSHGEIIEYGLLVQNSAEQFQAGIGETGKMADYYRNYMDWNMARQAQAGAYRATPIDWKLEPGSSQAIFTLGTDGRCAGQEQKFCNGELDPTQQYSVKGFTCTAAGCSETQFYNGFMVSPDLACVSPVNSTHQPYSDLELALIIVVAILLLILIIMIVLVLILCLKKQKQKEGRLLKGELNDGHDTMVRGQHMGLTKM